MTSLNGDLERENFRSHGWRSGLNAGAIIAFWQDLEPSAFDV